MKLGNQDLVAKSQVCDPGLMAAQKFLVATLPDKR